MNALALIQPADNLPALITSAGDQATLRFFEFFTVNIRNPNTRAAYARAAGAFLGWCELKGMKDLRAISRCTSPPISSSCRKSIQLRR